jgi:hypothetical protein
MDYENGLGYACEHLLREAISLAHHLRKFIGKCGMRAYIEKHIESFQNPSSLGWRHIHLPIS